jgi:hypothetical protein
LAASRGLPVRVAKTRSCSLIGASAVARSAAWCFLWAWRSYGSPYCGAGRYGRVGSWVAEVDVLPSRGGRSPGAAASRVSQDREIHPGTGL